MSRDVGEVMESLENELCYDHNYELCSFSNLSVTSPASQLILQPFRRFTYVTAHSSTLPSFYLRHSSFSILPSLHLRYSSFSNPSVAFLGHTAISNPSVVSPTSQLILQPFRRFTYFTAQSPTLLSLLLCHRLFTYVTRRAAHASGLAKNILFVVLFSSMRTT